MSQNNKLPFFHISPIRGLDKINEDCGYIFCSMDEVHYKGPNVLVLHFMDVEYEKHPDRFTENDAKAIKSFVEELMDKRISEFFICCDFGQSRSPAIAAALSESFGLGSDYIWNNKEDYEPNALVYRILKDELNKM